MSKDTLAEVDRLNSIAERLISEGKLVRAMEVLHGALKPDPRLFSDFLAFKQIRSARRGKDETKRSRSKESYTGNTCVKIQLRKTGCVKLHSKQ